MGRSGFLLRVFATLVLAALEILGCSSSDGTESTSTGAGGASMTGSSGSAGQGQAGTNGASGGAAGSSSNNQAGNAAGGAGTSSSGNDAGLVADALSPSDVLGAVDTGHGNKVLIYTKATGFVHSSTPVAAAAISKAATAKGLEPETSQDTAKFAPAQLSQYAVVVLIANSGEPFGSPGTMQVQTLIDFVRAGGGLVAIENANHAYTSAAYIALLGGEFNGHPAFGPDTCYKETDHPSVAMLPASFSVTDEIYFTMKFAADNQVVLRCGSDKRPISWYRTEGSGRVFYTALGHSDASWTNPPLVDGHVIPALLWTMGR